MLSNVQERIERSIFEVIREVCVIEGYTPDILTMTNPIDTELGKQEWVTKLNVIKAAKGFAIEIYSNSKTKGTKAVPRIVIIDRMTLPGQIASPPNGVIEQDPTDPNKYAKAGIPFESSNVHIDIHLVSETAKQERVLNAIIGKVFGRKRFIPYYDEPTEVFLMVQDNHFDYVDMKDNIDEKAYSYFIPDVFDKLTDTTPVSKIVEIKADIETLKPGDDFDVTGNPTEPSEPTGKITIDLTTTKYQ